VNSVIIGLILLFLISRKSGNKTPQPISPCLVFADMLNVRVGDTWKQIATSDGRYETFTITGYKKYSNTNITFVIWYTHPDGQTFTSEMAPVSIEIFRDSTVAIFTPGQGMSLVEFLGCN
jgi:hypothetical protein